MPPCTVATTIHLSGQAIVAAVGFARAGDARAAMQKGLEAQHIADATVAALDRVPSTPGDSGFRAAMRDAGSTMDQLSYVFAGFGTGEPQPLADMVNLSPQVLASVDTFLGKVDGQLSESIQTSELCRAVVAPLESQETR